MTNKFISLFVILLGIFNAAWAAKHKSQSTKEYPIQLAVCAIFRDEAPYLREWIEFHRLLGVQKFYLYNNRSSDNFKAVLAPYVRRGIVELVNWNYSYDDIGRWSPIQCSAYKDAIAKARMNVKWMAVLDIDEFLFPTQNDNLVDFLKDYEKFPAVCVNWQLYGTSNIPKISPNMLLIDSLVYKAPQDYQENRHIKSIVRPEYVIDVGGPHNFKFNNGLMQVNTNKEPFEGPCSPYIDISKARINHYWCRDEDFFQTVKINRRERWSENIDKIIKRKNDLNSIEDAAILRFVPKLRKMVIEEF